MRKRVFVSAIGCFLLGGALAWTQEQKPALEEGLSEIQKAGADVVRDKTRPMSPVVAIRFSCRSHPTDAVLAHLKNFPDLETLTVVGGGVTDKGMEALQGLTNLKSIVVNSCPITDKGLNRLKGLTALKSVYIRYTKVSEAGVQDLANALAGAKVSYLAEGGSNIILVRPASNSGK